MILPISALSILEKTLLLLKGRGRRAVSLAQSLVLNEVTSSSVNYDVISERSSERHLMRFVQRIFGSHVPKRELISRISLYCMASQSFVDFADSGFEGIWMSRTQWDWVFKYEILFGKLRPYFYKVGVVPIDGVC